MYNTCTTMKRGHAVIRLLCEFTITKWLDTGFNHATSGIWHSNNCSLAASPATVIETYQSFVISISGAIPLIIFKWEREKRIIYTIYICRNGMTRMWFEAFLTCLAIQWYPNERSRYELKKGVLDSFHDGTKKWF